MPFNPTTLNNITLVLAAIGGIFIIALWLSLVIWTAGDIRARSQSGFTRFLAILGVAVFFLPGMLIYWIIRPRRTIEEEYRQSLEDEALLRSVEEQAVCTSCGRRVYDDWIVCPKCHTELKKSCLHCGRKIDMAWDICPYCGVIASMPGIMNDAATLPGDSSNQGNTKREQTAPVRSVE